MIRHIQLLTNRYQYLSVRNAMPSEHIKEGIPAKFLQFINQGRHELYYFMRVIQLESLCRRNFFCPSQLAVFIVQHKIGKQFQLFIGTLIQKI